MRNFLKTTNSHLAIFSSDHYMEEEDSEGFDRMEILEVNGDGVSGKVYLPPYMFGMSGHFTQIKYHEYDGKRVVKQLVIKLDGKKLFSSQKTKDSPAYIEFKGIVVTSFVYQKIIE